MSWITFIVFSLFTLFVLAYFTFGRNLSRPSILYIGGFFICSLVAYCWRDEWGLHLLSPTTAFVIVGGAFIFYIVEFIDYRSHKNVNKKFDFTHSSFNAISERKLLYFLIFQFFSFILMAKTKMSIVGTSSLADALGELNDAQKFEGELVTLPFYVRYPYNFCRNAGYLWCILLPYYQFKSKEYNKQKFLLALNLLTCLVGVMLSGGRMGLLNYIIAYLSFYYISYQYTIGWKGGLLSKKAMAIIIAFGFAFTISFQNIGYIMGRSESDKAINYIFAIYCGAQIKNLDDYIRYPYSQGNESGFIGQYTFSGFYNNVAQHLGSLKSSRQFSTDLAFNSYGDYTLGNVYSAYYNYLADFGYYGVLCAGLMSLLFALFYRKMINSSFWENGHLDLWVAYYSYASASAFLCFFANHYLGSITLPALIRNLIFWWVLILYFQGPRSTYFSKIKKELYIVKIQKPYIVNV